MSQQVLNAIEIDEETMHLIAQINDVLIVIYQVYFDHETVKNTATKNTNIEKSFKALQRFLREFEICPRLINS
jgi:hypothetical protein